MKKAKVAILRTRPETVLDDYVRLFELAGGPAQLDRSRGTIIKDNISWHYPFPSANTTPWQLEATVLALKKNGFQDIACVQNKTEVTNAFKGEDLNNYKPIFRDYDLKVLFNFRAEDMKWVTIQAQGQDARSWTRSTATSCASPIISWAKTWCTCPRSSAISTPPPPAP